MINHLYWCAMSTEGEDEALIRAKWFSLLHHIHNVHTSTDSLFPKCLHRRVGRRKWLKPSKKSFNTKTIDLSIFMI